MKWRLVFLLCCAALIAMGGASVAISAETPWVCCEGLPGECPSGQVCCDEDFLGKEPCDLEAPGFCMERCIRVASPVAFTEGAR
jgi:hypothetical protein